MSDSYAIYSACATFSSPARDGVAVLRSLEGPSERIARTPRSTTSKTRKLRHKVALAEANDASNQSRTKKNDRTRLVHRVNRLHSSLWHLSSVPTEERKLLYTLGLITSFLFLSPSLFLSSSFFVFSLTSSRFIPRVQEGTVVGDRLRGLIITRDRGATLSLLVNSADLNFRPRLKPIDDRDRFFLTFLLLLVSLFQFFISTASRRESKVSKKA